VEVAQYVIRRGVRLPPAAGLVAVKQHGLWHHEVRNRLVARAARLLRDGYQGPQGESADISFAKLTFDEGLPDSGFPGEAPGRVVVLVEGVEHGLALARHLPGWPLVAAHACEDGLSADQVQAVREGRAARRSLPAGAVVTAAALQDLGLDDVAVVVRADGGTGLPFTPGQLVRANASPTRRLLLLDVEDRHHPLLRRWARQRHNAYRECGWFAPGVDPAWARVEHFLATRPKGGHA
jgi:hypothetical protein